jgi:ABC-type multidrug transport system fused ATPase/permease subunit
VSRAPRIAAEGRGRRIAAVALLALGQAAAAGVAAFATRDVFAALHAGGAAPVVAIGAIAAAGVTVAGLRVAERAVAERVGCDYATAVRAALFRRIVRLPQSTLSRRSTGGLALRFVGDLSAMRGWVAQGVARLISAAVVVPATLGVLALLDARLAAAAAAPVLLGLAAIAAAGAPLGRAHARLRRIRARLAAELVERAPLGAALRLVGRVSIERAKLDARSSAVADASVARARLAAAAASAPDAAAGVGAAAILGTAWAYGVSPATAAGALAAFGLLIHPLRSLASVRDRRQAWRVASTQLDRALAAPALPKRDRARPPRRDAPALALRGVRFDAGPTLDASVADGEVVILDGGPGAGKTRLLLAATGLDEPTAGDLRVFGRAPWALPTGAIGYVGAAAPLLRGSLRRNAILGARPVPDDAAVVAALRRAGFGPALARLGGLDGAVSEGGRNLSASERGRVLAARLLLARPRLLLIDADEAQLDAEALTALAGLIAETGAAALVATRDPAFRAAAARVWRLAGPDAPQGPDADPAGAIAAPGA